jgi:hypothetical protein
LRFTVDNPNFEGMMFKAIDSVVSKQVHSPIILSG